MGHKARVSGPISTAHESKNKNRKELDVKFGAGTLPSISRHII